MKFERLTNHSIIIKGKRKNDIDWQPHLTEVKLPSKTVFILGNCDRFTVKKVMWDFGDDTKIVTITNRKQDPTTTEISHIFRDKNCQHLTTLTVSASVFTECDRLIEPHTFTIEPCRAKASNYVDPELFKQQIEEFYQTGNMSDELALSVQQIAQRLSYAPNFINYTYREEFVGDALIKMFHALQEHKFDPKKGNPFSYFTKIAYHAFCNRIKGEKKIRDTHNQYQEYVYDTMLATTPGHGSKSSSADDYYGGYEE